MKLRHPLCEVCGQRGGTIPLYHSDNTYDLFHDDCARQKMEGRKKNSI